MCPNWGKRAAAEGGLGCDRQAAKRRQNGAQAQADGNEIRRPKEPQGRKKS